MRAEATDPVDERLLAWLRLLVDAAAVTGQEAALAGDLAARLGRDHDVTRIGDSLVVGRPGGDRPVIALVGHLDVVPPTDGDLPLRIHDTPDGAVAGGRGTSDMHAGNAVALELLTQPPDGPYDVVVVLYAREEGPAADNELADVLARVAWLSDLDLAVVLEPTDGEVHLGCLGGLHAEVTFHGRASHSARPWHGRNAVTAAGRFLAELDDVTPMEVIVDGVPYHDVWTVTRATTANARNVVPDRFVVNLNLRFAPSRSAERAEQELRHRITAMTAEIDDVAVDVEIVDIAPPAPPRRGDAFVERLVVATGAAVAGKQAWTDVARFAEIGVPAVNLGPGLTTQAHQRGEHVPLALVREVHDGLRRFLAGGS